MGVLDLQHRLGRAAPGKRVGDVPPAGNWLSGFYMTVPSTLPDVNSRS
jgi:hypothetical protein